MCTRPGKNDHVLVLPHKGVSPIPLLAPSSFFPAFSSFAGLRPSTDSAVSAYTPLLLPSGLSNKYFPLTGRKSTLEDYLVSRHGFTSIHLEPANHYVRTRKFTLVLSLSLPPPSCSMVGATREFLAVGSFNRCRAGKCKPYTLLFDSMIPPNGRSRGGGGGDNSHSDLLCSV